MSYLNIITLQSSAFVTFLVPLLAVASSLNSRQADGVISPINFLRRAFHASAVSSTHLYIDGGNFSYMTSNGPIIKVERDTLSLDLTQDWDNSSAMMKPSRKPTGAPNGGTRELFYHDAGNVLYTGISSDSTYDRPTNLWAFNLDESGGGLWTELQDTAISIEKTRIHAGITSSPDHGWLLGGTDLSHSTLSNMLQLDFSNRVIDSFTSPWQLTWSRTHFVPNFGPKGIILLFGGAIGQVTPRSEVFADFFRTIPVFDPAAKRWYNQSTTGEVPSSRAEHCVAGKASANQSYEIFVYGGHNHSWAADAVRFDTIHILTLPAFHWLRVNYTASDPRYGMTCHAVAGSQVLIVGGLDPRFYVEFGAKSGRDPFQQGLGIFDLYGLNWSTQYRAGSEPYVQAPALQDYYSRIQKLNTPKLDPDVDALIRQTNFTQRTRAGPAPPENGTTGGGAVATPDSNSSTLESGTSRPLNVAAIGGGVGGGSLLLLAVVGAVVIRARRHRVISTPQSEKPETHGETSLIDLYKAHLDGNPLTELDVAHSIPTELSGNERASRHEMQ